MAKIILDRSSVDKLGMLLAQIADLTKQADAIKDAIKGFGMSIEGVMFKASYTESDRKVFDKEAFIKTMGQENYDRFLKTTAVFSVKVTSR
jgi:hypothetical protein